MRQRRHIQNAPKVLKGQGHGIRKENGWKVNQMWAKGDKKIQAALETWGLSRCRSLAQARRTPGVLEMEAWTGRKGEGVGTF